MATIVADELDVLDGLVPLAGLRVVELGCGAAQLSRSLVQRYPGTTVAALEVDERQHAKNLAAPQAGIQFLAGGAQAVPLPSGSCDLVLMLKSLHHVPLPLMGQALAEAARLLVPGGHLYVSEPVYVGEFNEVIRVFNDEGVVRAAAQQALDVAATSGLWSQVAERRFEMPITFPDFADFEQRMMRPTFADHAIDDAKLAAARAVFDRSMTPGGAHYQRPMHVRLLRRAA